MKNNPIIMGCDDATFSLKKGGNHTYLIGVICQGVRIVKVQKTTITIDGNDATAKLLELIHKNRKHIQYVLTHTITFGGFNLIDMKKIFTETSKPIIAVTEREVNLDSVRTALIKKFPNEYQHKFENIFHAGNLFETEIETAAGASKIYFHKIGISLLEAEELLMRVSIDSKLPEPVRIAHLIGRAFRSY
jgi:hypothetical protein